MKKDYNRTLRACYLGFITQAITANFAPLLFLKFHRDYGIPLGKIALISTVFYADSCGCLLREVCGQDRL